MELRFTVSGKDGKLEKMLNEVPSQVRAEFAKDALRYYLRAIRDNQVESDYIDSSQLCKYQPNISQKIATMDDLRVLVGSVNQMQMINPGMIIPNQIQYINPYQNQDNIDEDIDKYDDKEDEDDNNDEIFVNDFDDYDDIDD